ncbi:MAG TPA: KEOPS complex subunit Pcc1 [Nitrososphaerales archaeon]|nr:KEOPS complex subunit Pcc1 [Nitrososphaerales archaeon]
MPTRKKSNSPRITISKVLFATLRVEIVGERKVNEAIASALSPELVKNKRFTFTLISKNNGRTILLKFMALDLVSLRAGMNTILRLALTALTIIRTTSFLD